MNKVDKLKEQISSLNTDIKEIQRKCAHTPDDVELEACIEWGEVSDGWNNGNSYPIYCTRIHCKACSLTWTVDRINRPQYAKLQKKTVEENKKKAVKKAVAKKAIAKKTAKKAAKRKV